MRYMTRRSLLGALTALALGAAVAIVWATHARNTEPPQTVTLQTASTTALAATGIRLGAPVGSAKIDEATASTAAVAEYPGSTVREAVLAQVADEHAAPALHCLCWAVSIAPPDGSQFPSSGPANRPTTAVALSYSIMFIDANTGQFVEGTAGE
jgi:hypothetical protein